MRGPATEYRNMPESDPPTEAIIEAIRYFELLDGLAAEFRSAGMKDVGKHLAAACAEIDRLWLSHV